MVEEIFYVQLNLCVCAPIKKGNSKNKYRHDIFNLFQKYIVIIVNNKK